MRSGMEGAESTLHLTKAARSRAFKRVPNLFRVRPCLVCHLVS
jgi:hypothetical protein